MMPSLLETLTEHRFLAGLPRETVARIAALAQPYDFPEGYRLCTEGEPADRFYLLRHGRVALDLHVAGRGAAVVETLGAGDVLGWSWLCPPHRWRFGAVALKPTGAIQFHGESLRVLCDSDPAFGYELARRLLVVVAGRLHATRVRFLDIYASQPQDRP
jgi:CRP-like cAMP-binding protein